MNYLLHYGYLKLFQENFSNVKPLFITLNFYFFSLMFNVEFNAYSRILHSFSKLFLYFCILFHSASQSIGNRIILCTRKKNYFGKTFTFFKQWYLKKILLLLMKLVRPLPNSSHTLIKLKIKLRGKKDFSTKP